MKKAVLITNAYKGNKDLATFIENLPNSFSKGGEMLWNGRNKIKAFHLDDNHEVVVKRFKPLKFIQKLGYLFHEHKAMKSFLNAKELISRGIDTPFPVACIEFSSIGLICDAYYFCERIDMPPIEALTDRDDWDQKTASAFAHFVASLHKKGILHHDLNDTNVRFHKDGNEAFQFSVIDINRMTFYDSIEDIPINDRIENLTRFTGRLSLFEFVIRDYAKICGLDIEEFTITAIEQKKRHDRNWRRRKHLLHPFKKK